MSQDTDHNKTQTEFLLYPYRVLDLSEGGCMIGGKILADLGAEVIKIEPPGGSPSRIAPYYQNMPHPEKSLFWFAYNINKKGITLDINKKDGQQIFRNLVKHVDVILESFEPGYMNKIGLGYQELNRIRSNLIVTSITPYGQNGPKAHYASSDLTAWASGGYLYICGDPDRPPNWIGFPQASLHAGVEAASGAAAAIWYSRRTGIGQHIDVSMQECVFTCCFNTPEMWDLNQVDFTRSSKAINIGIQRLKMNQVWECKDGYVIFVSHGGVQPFLNSWRDLTDWMASEGMADDWLKGIDWEWEYSALKLTQDIIDRVEQQVARFFMTKTKAELYEQGALKRRILIGPLFNAKDIWGNIQLQARDFWVTLEHPVLKTKIVYPGPFTKLNPNRIQYRYPAPLVGEHNFEIYNGILGFSSDDLALLKQAEII